MPYRRVCWWFNKFWEVKWVYNDRLKEPSLIPKPPPLCLYSGAQEWWKQRTPGEHSSHKCKKNSFDDIKVKVWSSKLQQSPQTDNPVCCFGCWTPPPYVHPHVHLTSFMWWMLPGLPQFSPVFHSCVIIVNTKQKVKTEEAWGRSYSLPSFVVIGWHIDTCVM